MSEAVIVTELQCVGSGSGVTDERAEMGIVASDDEPAPLETGADLVTVTVLGGPTSVTVVVAHLLLDGSSEGETNVTEVTSSIDVTTDGATSEEIAVLERATVKSAVAAKRDLKRAIAVVRGRKRVLLRSRL